MLLYECILIYIYIYIFISNAEAIPEEFLVLNQSWFFLELCLSKWWSVLRAKEGERQVADPREKDGATDFTSICNLSRDC